MSMFNMAEAKEMSGSNYITTGEHHVVIVGVTAAVNQDGSPYEKPALDLVVRKTGIESDDLNQFNKSFRLYYTSEGAIKISNARLVHIAKALGKEEAFRAIVANNLEDFINQLNTFFTGSEGFLTVHGEEYQRNSPDKNGNIIGIRPVLPISNFFSAKQGTFPFDEQKNIKRMEVKADADESTEDLPFFMK